MKQIYSKGSMGMGEMGTMGGMNMDVIIDSCGREIERDQCLFILAFIIFSYKIKFLTLFNSSTKHIDPLIDPSFLNWGCDL